MKPDIAKAFGELSKRCPMSFVGRRCKAHGSANEIFYTQCDAKNCPFMYWFKAVFELQEEERTYG